MTTRDSDHDAGLAADSLAAADANGPAIHPLDVARLLRSAGGALLAQLALHGQLARVEWAEEKRRLLSLLGLVLIGLVTLICLLLGVGALLLAVVWDGPYRLPVALALVFVYGAGVGIAWLRLVRLMARGSLAFAATREELAADIALIKSRL